VDQNQEEKNQKETTGKSEEEQEVVSDQPVNTKKYSRPNVSNLRTYEGDATEAIQKQKASLVSFAMAEKARRKDGPPQKESAGDSKNKKGGLILSASIILVAGGLIALFGGFFQGEDSAFVRDIVAPGELIFSNDREEINTTGLEKRVFLEKIQNIKESSRLDLGSILNIYPTVVEEGVEGPVKRSLSAKEFFDLFESSAGASLTRTFESSFMFGFHAFNGTQPFILIPISSYDNAFAGMLRWEKTMEQDLEHFFFEYPEEEIATTSAELLGTIHPFSDEIIRNQDVRVLRANTKENESLLMYSFQDRKHLIITTNEYTLKEVLDRLSRIRFSQ